MIRRSILLGLLLATCVAYSQTTQRLILKDGSYQSVQKYEIKGDNVHYLSAERYEWEDIPKSMVDWEATEKYQKDVTQKAADAQKADEEDAKASDTPNADAELPPGLSLPTKSGVFVLDNLNGKPGFVELSQNGTHSVQHNTAYMLTKKIAARKETIQLDGAHAKPQVNSRHPVIFIKPEVEQDEQQPRKKPVDQRLSASDAFRFELLKLDVSKNSRVVVTMKTDMADDTTQSQEMIPVYAQVVAGDLWIKIEPKQDLVPGEYALVQTLEASRVATYVWDFGVQGPVAAPSKEAKKSKH